VDNSAAIDQTLEQCTPTCAAAPPATGQPGNAGPSATAVAATASHATAIQQHPSNVNVTVRVASPGADGPLSQTSTAAAAAAAAVSLTTDADNVNVVVVLPGAPTEAVGPTGSDPWIWNWLWLTGAAPTAADAASTSSSTWNWTWTDALTGPAQAVTPTAGHWTWTWVWTRGDGWSQSYTWDQACTCTWAWTWAWTWAAPAAPAEAQQAAVEAAPATAETAPAPVEAPQVSQVNSAAAVATASTSFVGTQTAEGDAAAADVQSIDSEQSATAAAHAGQLRPKNASIVTAGKIDRIAQANAAIATAAASTAFTAGQTLGRSLDPPAGAAATTASAVQSIGSTQRAAAAASAEQTDPFNVDRIWSAQPSTAAIGAVSQQNTATANALAVVDVAAGQTVSQTQVGANLGDADQSTDAAQSILTTQAAEASADTAQTRVGNLNDVEIPEYGVSNPPLEQSNDASSSARATATGDVRQSTVQVAAAEEFAFHASGSQTATLKQSGDAADSAGQTDRLNAAGWRGLVARPADDEESQEAAPAAEAPALQAAQAAPAILAYAPHALSTGLSTLKRTQLRPLRIAKLRSAPAPKRAKLPAAPFWKPFASTAPGLAPQQAAASSFVLTAAAQGRFRPASHAAAGHPTRSPAGRSPACARCQGAGSAFSSGGAYNGGGAVAALTSRYRFAAPGAGRPHAPASTLGRSAAVAPIERPG
jgi:hypothetical protein